MAETKNSDLHLHTTASDGGYSPTELVKKCHDVGLTYIAITDHDTVSGVKEAIVEAEKYGMTVIPGIEFSTKEGKTSVHILGYGIDIDDNQFIEMLEEQQRLRKERMHKIIAKFNELNITITEAEILSEVDGASIGRPHIAKVLVKKGIVTDVKEAFSKYIGDGMPCYVKKAREMTPLEAFQWIYKTNGVAIVAHPVYYSLDDQISKWVQSGLLDGVEVYHRDHDEATIKHYEQLVAKIEINYHVELLKTGGSDFHHEDYGRMREPLGATRIDDRLALALIEKIKKRKNKK